MRTVLLAGGMLLTVAGCEGETEGAGRASGAAGEGGTAKAGGDDAGGVRAAEGAGRAAEPPRWEAHIRGDRYRKLIVEVDVVRGAGPERAVMDDVFQRLHGLIDKPDGIEVVFDEELEPHGAGKRWAFADLQALAAWHMTLPLGPGVDRIHVLWLDGRDADADDRGEVLGLAWDHRHIVMYKDPLSAGCAQLLAAFANQLCRSAELAVLTHEVGHVLGLVDNGVPMVVDHEDPEHDAHDVDPDSVMYWQHARDSVFDVLLTRLPGPGDPSLGFDENSLADLAAVRDR